MDSPESRQSDLNRDGEPIETAPLLPTSNAKPYSVFTTAQKRLIILAAALASAFSPLSANIYYPALNSIARDLRVSSSQINLTITTYMVCHYANGSRWPHYVLTFVLKIRSARVSHPHSQVPSPTKPDGAPRTYAAL